MVDFIQKKELNMAARAVRTINSLEPQAAAMRREDFLQKTKEFSRRLKSGETKEDVLPEAYALCREAAKRTLGKRPYDVQMMGSVVLNRGDIAEMRTGEGKTLAATAAVYLNAIEGDGVHVVTVNDYLAERDSSLMRPLYNYLGLDVGCIFAGMDTQARKEAYAAHITYGTASEFGFDYLRDNMALNRGEQVQRGLNFAVIDEVDSVLIDEARTPLIISGKECRNSGDYLKADVLVKYLRPEDVEVDREHRQVALSDSGVVKAERFFQVDNLGDVENMETLHLIMQALKANKIMEKDKDYIVVANSGEPREEGQVMIVDEFTGRVMPGRRFSDGLHQAIEAKERVRIRPESMTYATVTLQNYFRMYRKLAGMTGTARDDYEEFSQIYNMNVVTIPTNRPVRRVDHPDAIFRRSDDKFIAAADFARDLHRTGRPVLIGTGSVRDSEIMDMLLSQNGVPHTVLNARNNRAEAQIIAEAGRIGAVTVATDMAGRGTDIKLGGEDADEETARRVRDLGGLYIIGIEKHESRRIDEQLRGRAGRQGDPGETRFFLSIEDPFFQRFDGEKAKKLDEACGRKGMQVLDSDKVRKEFENVQRRIEGNNYGIRKAVLEYDNVMNIQRNTLYGQREMIIDGGAEMQSVMRSFASSWVSDLVEDITSSGKYPEMWDMDSLRARVAEVLGVVPQLPAGDELLALDPDRLRRYLMDVTEEVFREKQDETGEEVLSAVEQKILLHVIDSQWVDHLDAMEQLKQGIGLTALGQKQPAVEFAREGTKLFEAMMTRIESETLRYCARIQMAYAI